jgi:hypothetical protein
MAILLHLMELSDHRRRDGNPLAIEGYRRLGCRPRQIVNRVANHDRLAGTDIEATTGQRVGQPAFIAPHTAVDLLRFALKGDLQRGGDDLIASDSASGWMKKRSQPAVGPWRKVTKAANSLPSRSTQLSLSPWGGGGSTSCTSRGTVLA